MNRQELIPALLKAFERSPISALMAYEKVGLRQGQGSWAVGELIADNKLFYCGKGVCPINKISGVHFWTSSPEVYERLVAEWQASGMPMPVYIGRKKAK
jgi:hypothetical protein